MTKIGPKVIVCYKLRNAPNKSQDRRVRAVIFALVCKHTNITNVSAISGRTPVKVCSCVHIAPKQTFAPRVQGWSRGGASTVTSQTRMRYLVCERVTGDD
jgi:hypothetical protein